MKQLKNEVEALIYRNGLTTHDIVGVLSGFNGSEGSRKDYCEPYGGLFGEIPMMHYKHLFGECYSSSALAMYVGASCIAERHIPKALYMDEATSQTASQTSIEHPALLVYNNDGKNHSLLLLTAV